MSINIKLLRDSVTFFSSLYDIGMDLVSALDFLGYNATEKLIPDIMATTNSSDTNLYREKEDLLEEMHQAWGVFGIGILFLPGIIMAPIHVVGKVIDNDWCGANFALLLCMCFPISITSITFLTIFLPSDNQNIRNL